MRLIAMKLTGHLTQATLDATLPPLPEASCALLVDASEMTGYDVEARRRFVEWNAHNRPRVRRVAIVTEKRLWRAVISAMALASSQKMAAFDSIAEAEAWARSD